MTEREFRDKLSRRTRRAGISVPATLRERLWLYFQLLAKWNQKINLTGLNLDEPTPEGLDRLLIEPLVAASYANAATSLIDIGSGGGSPALPLALALAGVRLVMIEVKTRKSVFLREAARELALANATVETVRHESLLSNPAFHEAFDLLSVRAVRVEAKVFSELQSFVRPGGRILHFRTASESTPLLPPDLRILALERLATPRSQLMVLEKVVRRSTWNHS